MRWANYTLFFSLPPSFSLNAVLESLEVFCIRLHQWCILACSCLLGFFPFVNKQAVRFLTLQGDEGGGGVLGILYRLECQAKVSSASALEEVSKLTVSLVSSHLCSSLPGDICKPVVSPVQLGFQCIPLPLDNCWSCLCV